MLTRRRSRTVESRSDSRLVRWRARAGAGRHVQLDEGSPACVDEVVAPLLGVDEVRV